MLKLGVLYFQNRFIEGTLMMYTIAICDDDKNFLELIELNILQMATQLKIEVDIYKFDSGHIFLKALSKAANHYDIIFLDIDMPLINGLETAEKVRLKGIESILIFVTSMEDKVFEAFGFNALKFVLKRNLKDDLKTAFMLAIEKLKQNVDIFSFKTSEGIIRLTTNEIIYFIYEGRKVSIKTNNNIIHYLVAYTLAEIEEIYSKKGFILINRYALVNIKYVSSTNKNDLFMDNGDSFVISRPKLKEVYAAITDYLR